MPEEKEEIDSLFFAKARAKKAHKDGVMPFHEAMKGVEKGKPLIVIGTPYPGSDRMREIWAELSQKIRDNPDFIPITNEEIKNDERIKKKNQ